MCPRGVRRTAGDQGWFHGRGDATHGAALRVDWRSHTSGIGRELPFTGRAVAGSLRDTLHAAVRQVGRGMPIARIFPAHVVCPPCDPVLSATPATHASISTSTSIASPSSSTTKSSAAVSIADHSATNSALGATSTAVHLGQRPRRPSRHWKVVRRLEWRQGRV